MRGRFVGAFVGSTCSSFPSPIWPPPPTTPPNRPRGDAHVEDEERLARTHVVRRLWHHRLQLPERVAAVGAGRQPEGVLRPHRLAEVDARPHGHPELAQRQRRVVALSFRFGARAVHVPFWVCVSLGLFRVGVAPPPTRRVDKGWPRCPPKHAITSPPPPPPPPPPVVTPDTRSPRRPPTWGTRRSSRSAARPCAT